MFGDIFQHVMDAELMVDNEEEVYEFEPSILTRCYRDGILPPISGSFGHSQQSFYLPEHDYLYLLESPFCPFLAS